MSSDDAEFVEQPDGARLQTPRCVTRNGGAVRVRSHEQISDTASALVSEVKSKKGRVAPDREKKWKVILWYYTSNTARLDQIPERDELHLWKLFSKDVCR